MAKFLKLDFCFLSYLNFVVVINILHIMYISDKSFYGQRFWFK